MEGLSLPNEGLFFGSADLRLTFSSRRVYNRGDGKEPLDYTSIHPESYAKAYRLLEMLGITKDEVLKEGKLLYFGDNWRYLRLTIHTCSL